MVKYLTLEKHETLETFKMKFFRIFERSVKNFVIIGEPQKFMGNTKVITLKDNRSLNKDLVIKIDGPGFLIQELYEELT